MKLFIVTFFIVNSKNFTTVLSNFLFPVNNFTSPSPPVMFNTNNTFVNQQERSDSASFNLCTCKSAALCTTDGYWNIIDIRIVTPPIGTECDPGEVYCCTAGMDCGMNRMIRVPEIIPSSGQSNFGEYPWQVLIITLNNDYVGSGALITNNHIVTAAHRLTHFTKKGQHLFVRLGDWDLQTIKEPYPHVDVIVNQVMIHPQYDSTTLQYDVAILTLLSPVTTTLNINTICLPLPDSSFTSKTCWVSGWGKDMFGPKGNYQSIQKKVDVTILSPDDCNRHLKTTKLGPNFSLDEDSFVCAGGYKGKDACTGDGGSPLVCQNSDGSWMLAGLVAWGLGCAQHGVPGVYVNIPNMMSWIQQQIQPLPFNKR
ncbi:inactive CLIP domain-containing serine protease A3-like [Lycorma delicatula]|uniref:inactive CLIP domain-containing serine protease A3-like n=1 Tax=Lycorma delicatula TaxID=130591 RepID=UPI003F5172AC